MITLIWGLLLCGIALIIGGSVLLIVCIIMEKKEQYQSKALKILLAGTLLIIANLTLCSIMS
jgi:hypothetical protein